MKAEECSTLVPVASSCTHMCMTGQKRTGKSVGKSALSPAKRFCINGQRGPYEESQECAVDRTLWSTVVALLHFFPSAHISLTSHLHNLSSELVLSTKRSLAWLKMEMHSRNVINRGTQEEDRKRVRKQGSGRGPQWLVLFLHGC